MFTTRLCLMAGLCLFQPALSAPYGGFPEVSLGTNPNRHFSGVITGPGAVELLVLPEDQEFIVTLVQSSTGGTRTSSDGTTYESGIQLLQNGVVVVRGDVISPKSGASINNGRGRLRVEAGTTLSLQHLGIDIASYYVQGFLVHSGSPYRGVYGVTPSASFDAQTAFTTEADREFIIRTAALTAYGAGASYCDLAVDGETVIDGDTYALYDSGYHGTSGVSGAFVTGEGALTVAPGSTIQVRTFGRRCDYYIDGEYIQP